MGKLIMSVLFLPLLKSKSNKIACKLWMLWYSPGGLLISRKAISLYWAHKHQPSTTIQKLTLCILMDSYNWYNKLEIVYGVSRVQWVNWKRTRPSPWLKGYFWFYQTIWNISNRVIPDIVMFYHFVKQACIAIPYYKMSVSFQHYVSYLMTPKTI